MPTDVPRPDAHTGCAGPLVWFDTGRSTVLECAACDFLIVSGVDRAYRGGGFGRPQHAERAARAS